MTSFDGTLRSCAECCEQKEHYTVKAAILSCISSMDEFTSHDVISKYNTNPANTTRLLKVMCDRGDLVREMRGRVYHYRRHA